MGVTGAGLTVLTAAPAGAVIAPAAMPALANCAMRNYYNHLADEAEADGDEEQGLLNFAAAEEYYEDATYYRSAASTVCSFSAGTV
jgi:hypothetical protein